LRRADAEAKAKKRPDREGLSEATGSPTAEVSMQTKLARYRARRR